MAECQWSEKHLLGPFPPSSDGFIFKCYVNIIIHTEKALSHSLRRCYSLSWVMKSFALEAHKLWHQHLISFLSCQKQFSDGWSAPSVPPLSVCDCEALSLLDDVLWLTVSSGQTSLCTRILLPLLLYLLTLLFFFHAFNDLPEESSLEN